MSPAGDAFHFRLRAALGDVGVRDGVYVSGQRRMAMATGAGMHGVNGVPSSDMPNKYATPTFQTRPLASRRRACVLGAAIHK